MFRKIFSFSKEDTEDIINIFRILCGGALIAMLFQNQTHGIFVFVLSYVAVKFLRYRMGEKK